MTYEWDRLRESERGFCLGYLEARKDRGELLRDVKFENMTPEYRREVIDMARAVLAP